MSKKNGGTKAENIVKVSTNGREKRAEFIQTWGKKIVELWGANKKSITEVVKRVPGVNSWQVDYALCKLGCKKTTCKGLLQWIKDDEELPKANGKVVVKKAMKLANEILGGMRAEVVQYQKAEPKSKALIRREEKEKASVAHFKASSLPSEVIVGSQRS